MSVRRTASPPRWASSKARLPRWPGGEPRRVATPLPHPGVDEAARDAEGGRHGRQLVAGEPAGLRQLAAVDDDLAAGVLGGEADHQRVGEGPGLAAEVAHVVDLDARLLADLARHRFLQRLARR